MRIGRRSVSRGLEPEIDLSGPPADPGGSHLHAVLIAEPDGTWAVLDPGSANGTTVNGGEIVTGVRVPLRDGDRICVGAWTVLTMQAPPASRTPACCRHRGRPRPGDAAFQVSPLDGVAVGGRDDNGGKRLSRPKGADMGGGEAAERALQPEELDRLFLERANTGDVDGVVDLYEPDAVLVVPPGRLAVGTQAIRDVYTGLLAGRPRFTGVIRPAVRAGDLALTSTVRAGNATVEVARRQPDGSWRWLIDQPSVLE
jgi:ketosteroid isomerase-like protein